MGYETMIPIYRAKKIDSDEYVIGYLMPFIMGEGYFIRDIDYKNMEILSCEFGIDESTLSIHFPDMLDSQGNKIFASLSEDGKGGDCTFMENGYNETFCWDGLNACIVLKSKNYECRLFREYNTKETTFNKCTVIGTQQ